MEEEGWGWGGVTRVGEGGVGRRGRRSMIRRSGVVRLSEGGGG